MRWGALLLLGLAACSGELRFTTDGGTVSAACATDAECPGRLCDVARGKCLVACARDLDCDARVYPRECKDDFGPRQCAMCEESSECPASRPRCAAGQCVECDDDAHCPAGRCERATGDCVEQ